MTESVRLTRRGFMAASGAAVAVGLIGCGDRAPDPVQQPVDQTKAWVLGKGGRRTSNAANSHNNNMRFVSRAVADGCRAHPGDTSHLLQIDISTKQWDAWFGNGATKVDLRHV